MLVDFLQNYLDSNGLFTSVEYLNDRKILFASTSCGKEQKIIFNSHLDVVPAAPELFLLCEEGDKIYGRGTNDCLGNSALLANMLITLKDEPGIGVIFSTDEETGGATTAHMVDHGYKGHMVMVMDCGGYSVCFGQKGILTLKLTATGKAAHGSEPWNGDNAIEKVIDVYPRLKSLFKPTGPDDMWHTTCSINVFNAGTVFNRIPDIAEVVLDIRYTEEDPPEKLMKDIAELTGFKVEVLKESPVVFCDSKHELVTGFVSHMSSFLKREIPEVRLNGATDARHFVKLSVPVIMLGIPGHGAHADDEYALIEPIAEFEEMLVSYCRTKL